MASQPDHVRNTVEASRDPHGLPELPPRSSTSEHIPPPSLQTSQDAHQQLPTGSAPPSGSVPPAGPHALSLKVMRISAPSLASNESVFFEDPEAAQITHEAGNVAFARLPSKASSKVEQGGDASEAEIAEIARSLAGSSAVAAAETSLRKASEASIVSNDQPQIPRPPGSVSTLRDWPLTNLLVLPGSFGTIYLGETFTAYLCANNETQDGVAQSRLKVELQVGDPSASDAAPSMRIVKQTILLADLGTEHSDSGAAERSAEPKLLPPSGKLETIVRHEMRELGPHVLICTVSYVMAVGEHWLERSFRKFYKFSVPASPLAVRTRTYTPRAPNQMLSSTARLRERVLLDVSIENVGGKTVVVDALRMLPESGWGWKSISKGEWDEEEWDVGNLQQSDLWTGTSEHLLPTHIRQHLFLLYPLSQDPSRPIPPMPLGISAHAQGFVGSGFPPQRPGGPSRSTSSAVVGTHGRTQPSPAATVSVPLGRLDIAWRCGLGEQGRLQTSTLARRKQLEPPIACYADNNETAGGLPSLHSPQRLLASKRATVPSFDVRSVLPAAGEASPPTPLLECQVLLHRAPHRFKARAEMAFSLTYRIWLRDLSLSTLLEAAPSVPSRPPARSQLSVSGSFRSGELPSTPATKEDDDGSDSDDDKPLSELASPRLSTSARDAQSAAASDARSAKTLRRLKVALQFLAMRPSTDFASVLPPTPPSDSALAASPLNMELPSGPTTPLRDQRIGRTIGESGHTLPSSPLISRQLSYAVRSSIDSARGRSSLPTATTSESSMTGVRRGSIQYTPRSSRPTSPAASTATLSVIERDSDGPVVPSAVPPKEDADETRPGGVLRQHPSIPMPFFSPARLAAPGTIAWPSEHVIKLGSSLVMADAVTVRSQCTNADGEGEGLGAGDEGIALGVNEGTVDVVARYLATEEGVARIGGVRVLLMGWEDEILPEEGGGVGGKDTVQLETPVVLKEVEVMAEMWIDGQTDDIESDLEA